MKELRADDAVEGAGGDVVRLGEIGDDCRRGMRAVEGEDVQLRDGVAAEPVGVGIVSKLETAAVDVRSELVEELLQIVAMEGQAAIEPPHIAQRLDVEAETQSGIRRAGED